MRGPWGVGTVPCLVCGWRDMSSVGDNVAWDLLCDTHTGTRKTAELQIKLVDWVDISIIDSISLLYTIVL